MAKPLTDEFTAGIAGLDRSFVVLGHPSGIDLSNPRLSLLIRQLTDHRPPGRHPPATAVVLRSSPAAVDG
ncbi:hypothetical protein [Streptomyces sp. MS2.AVA.5]|uniref:Uncharacterized protein n=1 Tax=Streptomyces achmelvichensis TaxID=3134111 RepID=A0ACC6PN32_9ACTN